ncbi:amidohydrolase [Rhodovulum sulfidophilum]|uniref:amidohydrolase family protein n=1 Tax=Rhodovulum sulfidophilum TaxID=35806 RepID=UPI0019231DC9|nr:amidohydrolase family protein [Rhodovulum sulfidophilum]MBL3573219.1 amidohydrolase [Rhodovulum sulfidophilum]MCE8430894.1 amidohydrolase [Rhodovulum sulfidophilum]MCF4115867.1 amidohydrolase [Rhodovulum sulfidophilum]
MSDIRITNCHIHTFTAAHAPLCYPAPPVAALRAWPGLLRGLRGAARLLPWEGAYEALLRLEHFRDTGCRDSQRAVFLEVLRHYPDSARFVVLPMDLAFCGYGPVPVGLEAQHRELYELSRDPQVGHRVIPFATIHPDRPGAVAELRRCLDEYGFRGVKIYPRLGYAPSHEILMREVYPLCVERGLPVVSHCSRGGVRNRLWSRARADAVTDPVAHVPVLRAFPDLRLCLAHFGGDRDWLSYLGEGLDPLDPEARRRNWAISIADMIESGAYPNLFTDISYTLFRFAACMPLLKLFLERERLASRILFGSDFYMTRQQDLSEKAVAIRLRAALGEASFRRIAETNPAIWLGEA